MIFAEMLSAGCFGASMVGIVQSICPKPKQANPDAELIRLCAEACDINAGSVRIEHEHEAQGLPIPYETIIWPRTKRWHDLCATIANTPAHTLEGVKSKASVLADVIALEEPMVASLCNDLLGRAGA